MIGTDPLDLPNGARTVAGARAVGDTKIHGHADQRYVHATEVVLLWCVRDQRRIEEGWTPS